MSNSGDNEGYVIKVRGLPWSTTAEEIMKFFEECNISGGKAGIHMTMSKEGRPSGEAYIEMELEEDVEKACKRDREHMGHRYIEVFKAKKGEMEWVVKRNGANMENAMDDGCVRLRGLPFGCSKEEIAQFFSGLEIVPNGISLTTDYTGRSTGEAYVQFVNKDVAERALQKHKEKIGHRYIEIFRSSLSEIRNSFGPKMRGGPMGGGGGYNQRPAPYDRGNRFGGMNRFNNGRGMRGGNRDFDNGPSWNSGSNFGNNFNRGNMGGGMRGNMDIGMGGMGMGMRGGMDMGMKGGMDMGMRGGGGNFRGNDNWGGNSSRNCVHMRGLPFRATEQDIADFFEPLNPINIRIILENGGRASGEADVEFASYEEAQKAMSKDKSHMSHRYIELFLASTGPNSKMGSNFGGGGSGGFNNSMGNGPRGGGGGGGGSGGMGGGNMFGLGNFGGGNGGGFGGNFNGGFGSGNRGGFGNNQIGAGGGRGNYNNF